MGSSPRVLLLLLPCANALIRAATPSLTAPLARPPQLYLRGEYEGLAQALAAVTQLQSNTALQYCSSEQLSETPSAAQLQALFKSLDTDGDGFSIHAARLKPAHVEHRAEEAESSSLLAPCSPSHSSLCSDPSVA